jgi:hypothetical protein
LRNIEIKSKSWDKFLEEIADTFALKGRYKQVFTVRFAYENQCKLDEEIWQLAKATSIESYKKQMTSIYSRFANSANGCPAIDGSGAGKFEKLRIWLEEKYSNWLIDLTFIPFNHYYIERSLIESDCYQELLQPGAFLRIKAPKHMGKTWLLEQVLTQLRRKGYQKTLYYNFGLEDGEVFGDYTQFIQSFAAGVTNLLDLPDCLDKYWSKNLGSNQNITKYFEKYLLETVDKPLILALDSVDCIFEHDRIAVDFCKLLRGWNEKAKQSDRRGSIWRQLRLIVVHSTDVYSNLSINSSPLAGVGKIIFLPQFTPKQVQALAKRYQINLKTQQIDELINLIGGHPNLITEAFEHLTNSQIKVNWQEFITLAPTDAPPFGNHLRQLLWDLKQHPELATAFAEIISASQPIPLQSDYGFKLLGMGLVNLEGNNYSPKCNLYRQYFLTHLDEMS